MSGDGRRSFAVRHVPHAVALAFVAGVVAALAADAPGWMWAAAVPPAAAAWVVVRRGRASVAVGLALITAGVVGWAWGSARLAGTSVNEITRVGYVTGLVEAESLPIQSPRSVTFRARVAALRDADGRAVVPIGGHVLVDIDRRDVSLVRFGRRLAVVGTIAPPAAAAAPEWWRAYLRRQLVSGRLRVVRLSAVGARTGVTGLRDRLRQSINETAGQGLAGDRRAIVRGMALGGGSGLSEEVADEMRDAGLWHLLAVSGQNITLVALAVVGVLSAIGIRRRTGVATSAACIVVYCLLCDGGPSVARAGVVGALGIACELQSRRRDRWYLLIVGFAALVAYQPRSVTDPGLQLSFAAVVGLITVAPVATVWLRGFMPQRLAALAGQALAATIATAPVTILHFRSLSLVGLLVNVVAVPLAAPVVIFALGGAVAGLVWPPLGVVPTSFAGLGADVLRTIAHFAAIPDWASVEASPVWAIVAVAGAIAVPALGWWLWRAPTARGGMRPVRRRSTLLVCAVLLGVLGVALAHERSRSWPVRATATVLDVGQGDAILLQSPDGHSVLIDTGAPGDPAPVIARLRERGVRRLDLLALTHDQRDHAGAASAVMNRFQVGTLAAPRPIAEADGEAARRGIPRRDLRRGDRVAIGAWVLEVLWPPADLRVDDPNDASLVVRAEADGMSILLTGDAESEVLLRTSPERSSVLKVSHHGSADARLGELLNRVRPAVALISVGRINSFGHPADATLNALRNGGARVFRTDRSGDLSIVADGHGATVAIGSS